MDVIENGQLIHKEVEMEMKPYPQEHSCRLLPPKYDKYRRENCAAKHNGKCIDFVYGIKSPKESELQAMRYNKEIWTEASARSHCKEKKGTFEPAKKSEEENDMNLIKILTKSEEGSFEEQYFSTKQLQDWFVKNIDDEGTVIEEIVLFEEAEFKAVDSDKGERVQMVMSDSSLDRSFERVDQSGWKLKNYKKNPVMLFGHQQLIPAIGIMENVKVENGKLVGYPKFDPQEIDPFAWMIGEKVRTRTLRGGSIGYRVLKVEVVENARDGTRYILKEMELYEFSIVNVPALPSALSRRVVKETTEIDALKKMVEGNSEKGIEREKEIKKLVDGLDSLKKEIDESTKKIVEDSKARSKELEDLKTEVLSSKSKNVDYLFKVNGQQTSDCTDNKPVSGKAQQTSGLDKILKK